jgi:urease accessory protein
MDLANDGAATLLLLNPTGGILAGDHLQSEIVLGPGSRVCLSTPSATRVYRSPGPPALQRTSIRVGTGAVLEWLPDHLIPSPGARLRQATDIALAADAALLYVDAWAVGRVVREEAWGFDLLDIGLRVNDGVGPLLRERSIIDGGPPRDGLGGTEGFAYVATFAAVRPAGAGWSRLARDLQDDIARAVPDCRVGVTTLGRGGVLARMLCPSAPRLKRAVDLAWARSRRGLLGLPPMDLRKL